MLLVAAAHAATVSLRIGYAPGAALEWQVGGTGHVVSVPLLGGEIGADVRLSDAVRVGASGMVAYDVGYSVGGLVDWAPRGWTRFGPVVVGRLSYSIESGSGGLPPGVVLYDWPAWYGRGPMLQVRPGVRVPFGKRGAGLTVALEGRLSYRFTGFGADGVYAGGLVGVSLGLDVPVADLDAP